jgi:hypothetical protein
MHTVSPTRNAHLDSDISGFNLSWGQNESATHLKLLNTFHETVVKYILLFVSVDVSNSGTIYRSVAKLKRI